MVGFTSVHFQPFASRPHAPTPTFHYEHQHSNPPPKSSFSHSFRLASTSTICKQQPSHQYLSFFTVISSTPNLHGSPILPTTISLNHPTLVPPIYPPAVASLLPATSIFPRQLSSLRLPAVDSSRTEHVRHCRNSPLHCAQLLPCLRRAFIWLSDCSLTDLLQFTVPTSRPCSWHPSHLDSHPGRPHNRVHTRTQHEPLKRSNLQLACIFWVSAPTSIFASLS